MLKKAFLKNCNDLGEPMPTPLCGFEALPRPWLVIEDANHHYNGRHAFYGLDDRMLAVPLVVFNAPDPSFLASRKFSIGD